MNWKEYLKTQGYTDAEITSMETSFGADKMSKAFEGPIRDKIAAETAAATARQEKEDFERFYNEEVLPKVSSVYQDAINARTEAAAFKARLGAAKEFGFLSDPKVVEGVVPGVVNTVPGSPATVTPAPGAPAATTALDNRYVSAEMFTRELTNVPQMLANLTKISNEHFSLFGSTLMDIDDLVKAAQDSKGKINVRTAWESKYKVPEKRAEIEKAKTEAHDKQIAEEAVRKYASEHNMPFTTPGKTSVAPHFTPHSSDEARMPWKGSGRRERKEERRQLFMNAMNPAPAKVQ